MFFFYFYQNYGVNVWLFLAFIIPFVWVVSSCIYYNIKNSWIYLLLYALLGPISSLIFVFVYFKTIIDQKKSRTNAANSITSSDTLNSQTITDQSSQDSNIQTITEQQPPFVASDANSPTIKAKSYEKNTVLKIIATITGIITMVAGSAIVGSFIILTVAYLQCKASGSSKCM
ncbi:MAG: hypothetical protein WCK71_01890 [bacterium]